MEALEFLEKLHVAGVKADLVIFDPPYSIRQCVEMYEGIGRPFLQEDAQQQGGWYKHKEVINQVVKDGGVVLSFGWNTVGMGKKYGFDLHEIMLVCHGRAHNDTICIAERKIQAGMFA